MFVQKKDFHCLQTAQRLSIELRTLNKLPLPSSIVSSSESITFHLQRWISGAVIPKRKWFVMKSHSDEQIDLKLERLTTSKWRKDKKGIDP